jgi:hypothetical protein|tara:strand:- start:413 stop:646 length:234 start_codon:yes stop_codon:yes gene_type:complete
MSAKSKLAKYQITDLSEVNTLISDRIIYYDNESKGLLNLIKFKDPKKDKDKLLSLIMKNMRKKVKASSKSSSKLTTY